jgi:hypothetical protein
LFLHRAALPVPIFVGFHLAEVGDLADRLVHAPSYSMERRIRLAVTHDRSPGKSLGRRRSRSFGAGSSALPSNASEGTPRMVDVIGATVTVFKCA